MKKITKDLNADDLIRNVVNNIMTDSPNLDRLKALNNEVNNHIIDTVVASDTGLWETGIKRDSEWIIVQQYRNEKSAKTGHNKWVKLITKNSKAKLEDINLYNL